MNPSLIFWVIFVLWTLFGAWSNWPAQRTLKSFGPFGGNVLLWLLILMIGAQVFGLPGQGK
jgi:hypothetical protein